jgi:hypothetical protein
MTSLHICRSEETFVRVILLGLFFLVSSCCVFAQSPNGSIRGIVFDADAKSIAGAEVIVVNDATGAKYVTSTNADGLYAVENLPPGPYRIQVSKVGFKGIIKPDIILNVQDALSLNFTLPIGAASVTVTVEGGAPLISTESAAVSTIVDRQFAENLPLNGRSFQTLIELTPGVVVTPVNQFDGGQFSVNGQRPSSNYWTVDGVSANLGLSATSVPGNGLSGSLGSFSALGGTNSLVSVDALQEFRIQTSTYAPEFGRTPGAQISIVTRSGTNGFHGTAFDYLRNDKFDANDWFANYAHLAKPRERQNDFGGTFSGPLLKNRTFFFFSYEGLRLRLPAVVLDTVPDATARANAVSAMQPYLNAFPLDPAQPDLGNGIAQYNASYANAASLDAYSLRIDHRINGRFTFFARYNYSPSELLDRGANGTPLSVVTPTRIATQTATAAFGWFISPALGNDLRFNYSRADATSSSHVDSFGGAAPFTSLPFPASFDAANSFLAVGFFALNGSGKILSAGRIQSSVQRQINLVDGFYAQRGGHSFKFGADVRRLAPSYDPRLYWQVAFFLDMPTALMGNPAFSQVTSSRASWFLFHNLGLYAQDTWRVNPRLSITYGLRWDVDFAPSANGGPNLPAVTGFNLNSLGNLALAPAGTAPFSSDFGNVAPRIGAAYQLANSANRQTVLRGGFGVFYDLATSEFGSLVASAGYPFSAVKTNFGGTFPLASGDATPSQITVGGLANCCSPLAAFDPHLRLPYTLQWNVAMEQGLGIQQSFSMSYVGASGRRLLQSAYILSPNANFYAADLVSNTANSNYQAMQAQFQRRLSRGLQALASYTLSHSIDDGSSGSRSFSSNQFVPALGSRANRGPSDFDIRHSSSAGVTYDVPSPKANRTVNAILRGWSTQNLLIAFSAPPVDVSYSQIGNGALFGSGADIRPDLVPGQPLYLYGAQCIAVLGPPCAGGKGFNPAAFASPPLDPVTGNPLRQGNLGRNALRGYGAMQWDFAVHRDFAVSDRMTLQFRAELFNLLNHPNFGPPVGDLQNPQALSPQFGQSQATLGQTLSGAGNAGNGGNGSFNPLYQIGGPRSIQLALKLSF